MNLKQANKDQYKDHKLPNDCPFGSQKSWRIPCCPTFLQMSFLLRSSPHL